MIYLDNCATTKPRDEVAEIMYKALKEDFANPSSLHKLGLSVEKSIEQSRMNISKFINAQINEIYFTSGGTESNNIAINGLINKSKKQGNKIITTPIEHSSTLDKLRSYSDKGFEVIEIGVDRFANLKVEDLYAAVDKDTILISLSHVNNEIGTISDVEKIIKTVKKINPKIFVHVDGVQAFGKIEVDVKKIGCDSYSFSSHKVYGPKGVGGLYVKNSVKIEPLVLGGGQEKGLRSGTENVVGILGFSKAVECLDENFEYEQNHAKKLKQYLIENLYSNLTDFELNTPKNASPYILSIAINGVRAEVLLHYLEQDDIFISTASACTANGTHKSHVLSELGLKNEQMEGTIRVCTSKDITKDDIDFFIEKLCIYVKEIREIMKR